jgi:hypothetical protein
MARARNLKPSFFKSLQLAECQPLARLLFQGLWCQSDKEGRLRDQPRLLKIECLPFDECDVDTMLDELQHHGLIIRYQVKGMRCIFIPTFVKHQNPHPKEQPSELPEYVEEISSREITRQAVEIIGEQQASNALPSSSLFLPPSIPSMSADAVEEPRLATGEPKLMKVPSSENRGRSITGELGDNPICPAEYANFASTEFGWSQSRIDAAFAEFVDYWCAIAGSKGRKSNWLATWRNRVRELHGRAARGSGQAGGRVRDNAAAAVGAVISQRYGAAQPGGGVRGGQAPGETGTYSGGEDGPLF